MNYYVLLGVPKDADPEAIRSAFRARARQYHPDAGDGSSSDRFREILAAYRTLNDPHRRGNYDRFLERRATVPPVVEPLRRQVVPEPMLRRQRVVDRNAISEPLAADFTALVDELFRSWEEVLFGDLQRRDRLERSSGCVFMRRRAE